jgi:hypothetical protein
MIILRFASSTKYSRRRNIRRRALAFAFRLHAVPPQGMGASLPRSNPQEILPSAGSLIRSCSVHDVAVYLPLPRVCPASCCPGGPKFERADRSSVELKRSKQAPSSSSVALFQLRPHRAQAEGGRPGGACRSLAVTVHTPPLVCSLSPSMSTCDVPRPYCKYLYCTGATPTTAHHLQLLSRTQSRILFSAARSSRLAQV